MQSPIVRRIAELVGVTPRTVERALGGELKDTRPTIVARNRRIKELADEFGYRPNAAARAVATGRFGCVALVVFPEQELLPARMVRRICDQLHRELDAELKLVMLEEAAFLDPEEQLPRILRELSIDALMVVPSARVFEPAVAIAAARDLPVVWLNFKAPHDAVYPDETAAAEGATASLLARGHRRVAYAEVTWGSSDHFSRSDRFAGHAAALAAAGLEPRRVTVQIPSFEQLRPQAGDPRVERWREVLAGPERPSAVLCYELHAAGAVMAAALLEGIKLGPDLEIISFASARPVDLTQPMGILAVPFDEIGSRAVDLLARKLAGGSHREASIAVPYPKTLQF
jgi:LacI family transcriptional regulator